MAGGLSRWFHLLLAAFLAWPLAAQHVPESPAFVSPLAPLDASSAAATLGSLLDQARRLDRAYAAYLDDPSIAGQRRLREIIGRTGSLFDLGGTPPAAQSERIAASFAYLKDILMRLPPMDPAALPPADRVFLPGTEIEIRRQTDGPREGGFLFSAGTLDRLPQFHARIIDYPVLQPAPYESWREEQIRFTGAVLPGFLTTHMPEVLEIHTLGTPLWKVLATLAILAGFFWLAERIWRALHRLELVRPAPQALALRSLVPFYLVLAGGAVSWFVTTQINLSGAFFFVMRVVAIATLSFAAAWLFRILCLLVGEWLVASPRIADLSYDAHLVRLIVRAASIFGAAAIVVYGANEIGVPLLGLIAGIGVGGFALALAAQSTVENLFGGVSLFADKPFRVGDFIIYPGGEGTVESIGTRSTRIRALNGMQVSVPNADLAKMQVTNKTSRDATLFRHVVGLRYETTLAQLRWFEQRLRERLSAHPMVDSDGTLHPPPRVRVVSLGPSSIDVEIRADILARREDDYHAVQEELLLGVLAVIEEGGLGLAFPSQTTYVARDRLPESAA